MNPIKWIKFFSLSGALVFVLLSTGFSSTAWAACANPAGSEGEIFYNSDQNVPQICAGLNWVALGVLNPGAGGSGCTFPDGDEGEVIYNQDYHVPQYCDGDDWVRMITAGAAGSTNITAAGWGNNNNGRAGLGSVIGSRFAVTTFPAESANWSVFSASSDNSSCGIRTTGALYCWGGHANANGLGGATPTVPTQVGSDTDWQSISISSTHSCGVRGGLLYCWGDNQQGKTGLGTTTGSTNTPNLVAGFSDWEYVSASTEHSCGIRGGGLLYCWGRGGDGQNGLNGSDVSVPTQVGSNTDWTDVSASLKYSCGIRAGLLYCWGSNASNKNAYGSATQVPTQVDSNTDWTDVSTGDNHGCAIRGSGILYCWGANATGKTGLGITSGSTATPTLVTGFSDWQSLSLGGEHSCGIRGGGFLYCWGQDGNGRLGQGQNGSVSEDSLVPTQTDINDHWLSVSAGNDYTLGIFNGP